MMTAHRSRLLVICSIALMTLSAAALAALLLVPTRPQPVPASVGGAVGGPFTLTASDGSTVTDQTYRGKWLLVYFGYTFCPDACPTALNNIGVALATLGSDAAKFQPLFITVDPRRDTREVLAEYLKSFDPRIVALTGTEDQIAAVARAYRVYYAPQKGEDYLVDHSALIYLMNHEGKFVKVFGPDLSGEEIADRVRQLIKQSV
jgi:protein SCO1/2